MVGSRGRSICLFPREPPPRLRIAVEDSRLQAMATGWAAVVDQSRFMLARKMPRVGDVYATVFICAAEHMRALMDRHNDRQP